MLLIKEMNPRQSEEFKRNAADLHKNVPADWYARSIKENLLQRYWHTRRFTEVPKLLEPTRGKILDIGCADGTFTSVILKHTGAGKIIGIDVLPKSVSYARRRFARSKKLSFRVADAHNLPFRDKEFDVVVCLETLEHVEDPRRVLSEIKRVLKKDGYLIVLVPSENLLFRIGWPFWLMTRGKIWKNTHVHQFTGDQIVSLIKEAELKIEKNHKFILGMLQAVKARKKK